MNNENVFHQLIPSNVLAPVVLRITNSDRGNIITALRFWMETYPSVDENGEIKALVKYIDNASGEIK